MVANSMLGTATSRTLAPRDSSAASAWSRQPSTSGSVSISFMYSRGTPTTRPETPARRSAP